MSELWAYCDACRRWFYPDQPSNGDAGPTPTCPVCATDAVTLAQRPEQTA
jgi:hypothetical protein